MNEELITVCVKQVLGAFSLKRQLLAWNSYECHVIDTVRKDLTEMNVNSVIIPRGCTKYIQASDVCCDNPFKATMTELYDE